MQPCNPGAPQQEPHDLGVVDAEWGESNDGLAGANARLLHRVLAAAVFAIAAFAGKEVVADFVEFLARGVGAGAAAAVPAALDFGPVLVGSADTVPVRIKARVIFAMLEAAAFAEFALTILFKVETFSAGRVGDGFAFAVRVLALVAIAAASFVAVRAANFFCGGGHDGMRCVVLVWRQDYKL